MKSKSRGKIEEMIGYFSHVPTIRQYLEEWQTERPELNLIPLGIYLSADQMIYFLDFAFKKLADLLGMERSELILLLALRRKGRNVSIRPSDLQQQLLCTQGAVTKQLDRLQKLGFIKRAKGNSRDARSIHIQLTDAGFRTADKAITEVALIMEAFGKKVELSPTEWRAIGNMLSRLSSAAHQMRDYQPMKQRGAKSARKRK